MNNFLAVTHEKNKVGWIHESKIGKFDIKSLGSKIDLKELLRMCLKSENKSKNIEYCPIFKFDSLKPKIKFNHKENFCNDIITSTWFYKK